MGSVSGRAVKLFVKTIKHSLSESIKYLNLTLNLFIISFYEKPEIPNRDQSYYSFDRNKKYFESYFSNPSIPEKFEISGMYIYTSKSR